jgi:hypothetical protein
MLLGTVAAWWVSTWGCDCLDEQRIAQARGNDLRAAESPTANESVDQAIAEKKKKGFKGVDFSYDALGW